MVNLENLAESEIIKYLQILRDKGYEVSQPQRGNYCFEASINRNSEKVKLLIYYGKKGIKKVLQGNSDSDFFSGINQLIFSELPFEKPVFAEPDEYIGTDESGKGDFFGPLVIAGVFVDSEKKKRLDEIGVRDSKLIAHASIKKLSESIKRIAGTESFNVVIINPPKYNELYEKFGNLNKLLAWGHARVLENILTSRNASTAISDKFGDEELILNSLQKRGKELELHQFHKAEKYTAVAAASILARERFDNWFDIKEKELNLKLPKGASARVTETSKYIKGEFGAEFLARLTKTHFKTNRML